MYAKRLMTTTSLRRAVAVLLVSIPALCLTACSSGGSNSGSSGGGTTTVSTPTVSSISPAKLTAGVANTTLTVTGTNFISTSTLQVGGVVDPTTYVSASQLTATVSASQLAAGGNLSVIVLNGESTSASGTVVNLEVDNPVPAITSFTPSTLLAGAASATVSMIGTGFVPTTTIQINGASRGTAYISSTQVNVDLTAADLAMGETLP